ncbi:MAG: proton-conducting transporter membrane subunit [Wolbachia sp.]
MNSCNIYITIIIDFISTIFLSTVIFISSIVIFYSGNYISNDKSLNRFIYIVIIFVISIIILIIRPNIIRLILGWDGLGLVSYCLVIYYQNLLSANAGMLTAIINRIGDIGILISIA